MQELDFNEARADLDSVLQNIVAKANAGDESVEDDKKGDEADASNQGSMTLDRSKLVYSDTESPRKAGAKSARKRKRKEDVKEEKHKANSCVMKLFDRSVDLAQFSEDTPLYPICRAWMTNDPYKDRPNITRCDYDKFSHLTDGVIMIPPPDKLFDNFTVGGKYVSPRIPSPPPQPKDDLESYLKNEKPTPRAETLLLDNLQHWKSVREKWRIKSAENEHRYSTGMNLLKEIASNQGFSS